MYKKIQRVFANIVIILSILMMIRAQIDSKNPLGRVIFKTITPIQNYLSMWRGWQMFAPNPLRMNSQIVARIHANNKVFEYAFPGPKGKDKLQSYLVGERWRKYLIEGVRLDKNKYLFEDCAKWVLRKYKEKHPEHNIRKIDLVRKWSNIPPWDQYFVEHRSDSKIEYKEFKFYSYTGGLK